MGAMGRCAWLTVALVALSGCGGGGGGGGSLGSSPSSSNGVTYTRGVFAQSSSLANQCASPRPGTADRSGSAFTENMFLRSWTNELYLWYSEVPDTDPSGFTTAAYFEELKTPLTTASGRDKDQFHFTYPTDVWEDLSQGGIEVGYGAQWMVLKGTPPRRVVVAFVEPNTPASTASVMRGAEVIRADGVDVVMANSNSAVDQLNCAFFPVAPGEQHTFMIREVSCV